jgi:hypothetical protein
VVVVFGVDDAVGRALAMVSLTSMTPLISSALQAILYRQRISRHLGR